MLEFLTHLFDTADYPPRWHCGRWTPAAGWLHICSDIGIWSAYVSIPLVLLYFLRRRRNLPFRGIFVLFGAFILACGLTHLMEAIIFWWPAYRLAGLLKLFTAILSWGTVLALFRITPIALSMRSPDELQREIDERKQVEAALYERSVLAGLTADVGVALSHDHDLPSMLQKCAESLVARLDVAFARIWTLNEAEAMLELQASAGIYTHLDGGHARVPVGKFKIGLIAAERTPHLTNAVIGDPRVGDQEWARREGMIAFAGYPLMLEERLVGVMAVFARRRLSEATTDAMAAIADAVALGIDRKRAETDLQRTLAALSEREARLGSILETAAEGIITANEQGVITSYNRAATTIFGYAGSEVIGRNVTMLMPPEMRGVHPQYIAAALQRPIESIAISRDAIAMRKCGSLFPVRVAVSQCETDQGRAITAIITDLTDERRLQSQLANAQKLESIGQLAAGIAHEINTPVQYVSDNNRFLQDSFVQLERLFEDYDQVFASAAAGSLTADLLQQAAQTRRLVDLDFLREEVPQAIQQSLEGLHRVATIVRAMKEFSHPGAEEKTPTDLNRCIESTLTVARNEWKYAANLTTDLAPDLPLVPCHPNDFNQVILNLVVNAAHAIADVPQSGKEGKGTIHVSTRRIDDWVEVRVQDSGGGIPEAIRGKVFDPFFTTKAVGRGTGQGLAIAYSTIVEKHGGSIHFETELNVGTTFIVRLPLDADWKENAQDVIPSGMMPAAASAGDRS